MTGRKSSLEQDFGCGARDLRGRWFCNRGRGWSGGVVAPFQGAVVGDRSLSQGVALGWGVVALRAGSDGFM